jgi:hypothetical protein
MAGGCFADEYHWRKGIGPAGQRPATLNPNWGGVIEPNAFGTHEFMDFIDQIDSEAYISVNVGSGTPQEAAEWLEYLDRDAGRVGSRVNDCNGFGLWRARPGVRLLGRLGDAVCLGPISATGSSARRNAGYRTDWADHSYLSAVIGSILVARRAGR